MNLKKWSKVITKTKNKKIQENKQKLNEKKKNPMEANKKVFPFANKWQMIKQMKKIKQTQ